VLRGTPYSYKTRFERESGTNPEELIAAAHAGCFSMALSMILGQGGFAVSNIETEAEVTLQKQCDGFAITQVHLEVQATVPGVTAEDFQTAAHQAKTGCPVSKVLNAEITMEARLIDIG
tara:strand:+ start:197 stop:553 length:357 start_codon:yes stop_codon:yes gene_type:complete